MSELLDAWWTWSACSPFVLTGCVVRMAWRWGVTERLSAVLRMPGTAGLLAAALAGCAYLTGVLAQPWLDPADACPGLGFDHPVVVQHDFPLSARCTERGAQDGSGVELVPGWVHPVVVGGLLVAAVAFAIAAVRVAVRAARDLRTWRRDRAEQRWADAEEGSWQAVAVAPAGPGATAAD